MRKEKPIRSFREVEKRVKEVIGWSRATTLKKIKKLEKMGLIKIRKWVDGCSNEIVLVADGLEEEQNAQSLAKLRMYI